MKCIFSGCDSRRYGIDRIHLWGYQKLLDCIPDHPHIVKHCPYDDRTSILNQLRWQKYVLPKEAGDLGCELMFNTHAGSLCDYKKSITLSQNLLPFEPGERQRYGWSRARLRLELLRYLQARSLLRSTLAIFLTDYAARTIQREIGRLATYRVIPHGITPDFFNMQLGVGEFHKPLRRLLYVSNTAHYKHQWNVVKAVKIVRDLTGRDVTITLVGGGAGDSLVRLEKAIDENDPTRRFVRQLPFLSHRELFKVYQESDMFVFASSCENMPVTLLEAMATGIPVVCSSRGPMPETLGDAGVYFNPENSQDIASAIIRMFNDEELCRSSSVASRLRAGEYGWERCAVKTWETVSELL